MNSLKKIADLATRFERKLSLAQQVTESNIKGALKDAVFDPKFAEREQGFIQSIMRPDSNFQAAAGNISGKISIGIIVDAPAKKVDFTVSSPGANAAQLAAVRDALKKDYRNMYRVELEQQFQDRLAKNLINPPTLKGSLQITTV